MYHNNELMNSKLNLVIEDESLTIPSNIVKCRFSEIDIGSDFLYNGELVIKKSKYNAISKRKTNKHEYLFFGNELVNIVNNIGCDNNVINNKNFEQFDFRNGSLNIFNCPPNNGKSTFLYHLAAYYIQNNKRVLFLQSEQDVISIYNKIYKLTKSKHLLSYISITQYPVGIPFDFNYGEFDKIIHLYDVILIDNHIIQNREENLTFILNLVNIGITNNIPIIMTVQSPLIDNTTISLLSTYYSISKIDINDDVIKLKFEEFKNRYKTQKQTSFICDLSLDYLKG